MPDWLVMTTIGLRSSLVQKRANSKIPGTNSNWSDRWIYPRSTLITPSRSRKSALLCIAVPIYTMDKDEVWQDLRHERSRGCIWYWLIGSRNLGAKRS